MTISLLSALWVYTGILSPFLLLVFYPMLEKAPRLFAPKVFVPAVASVSVFWFLFWPENLHYSHFLVGGGLLIGAYLVLGRVGYSRTQSAVLGVLSVLAADQLWQIPYDIHNWTSPTTAAVGLATQGFDLMSIPILGYFLLRFAGKLRMDELSWAMLGFSAIVTISETFSIDWRLYWLMALWMGFLLAMAVASKGPPPLISTPEFTG